MAKVKPKQASRKSKAEATPKGAVKAAIAKKKPALAPKKPPIKSAKSSVPASKKPAVAAPKTPVKSGKPTAASGKKPTLAATKPVKAPVAPKPAAKKGGTVVAKSKPSAAAAVKPKSKAAANVESQKQATVKSKPATKSVPKVEPAKKPVSDKKPEIKAPVKEAKPPVAASKPAPAVPAKPAVAVAPPGAAAPPLVRTGAAVSGKTLSRTFLFGLAQAIKEAVEPVARAIKGREIVSTAPTGDATFELDRIAEKALLSYLKNARAPVAYYSEDAGYSTFSNAQPKHLLIVDPIDGTRAAKSGFEGCVVAVASTRVIERPTIGDLDNACVMEIMGDKTFYAERGAGARIYVQDAVKRPKLSLNTNLEMLTWSMTVPARPAELIFPTAARLIDLSSLKGGFFSCNSSSYSLTRLLTNQLDACVDFAARYMKDIPELVRDYFLNAGRGVILGIAPYDFAAALLISKEAGCVVTDAFGHNFESVLLLDSSPANHQSLVAAASKELHEKLLSFFDTRIRQFEGLLQRRAAAQAARRESA